MNFIAGSAGRTAKSWCDPANGKAPLVRSAVPPSCRRSCPCLPPAWRGRGASRRAAGIHVRAGCVEREDRIHIRTEVRGQRAEGARGWGRCAWRGWQNRGDTWETKLMRWINSAEFVKNLTNFSCPLWQTVLSKDRGWKQCLFSARCGGGVRIAQCVA